MKSNFNARLKTAFFVNLTTGASAILALGSSDYHHMVLPASSIGLAYSAYAICREKWDKQYLASRTFLNHNAEHYKIISAVMTIGIVGAVGLNIYKPGGLSLFPVAIMTLLNSVFTASWMAKINIQKMNLSDLIHAFDGLSSADIESPNPLFIEQTLKQTRNITFPIQAPAPSLSQYYMRQTFIFLEGITKDGTVSIKNVDVQLTPDMKEELAPYCLAVHLSKHCKIALETIMEQLSGQSINMSQSNWMELLIHNYHITGTFNITPSTLNSETSLHF